MFSMLAEGVRWFDDWFAVCEVAPGLHAIGEPRFHQVNWNYLVTGHDRALLFDTGPGVRDISVVVRALTPLPVTAMPSHMHYDHTGNLTRFADLALADLPVLRKFERNGRLQEPAGLFLGHEEGMQWTPVAATQWWPPGHSIDLGGRVLKIIATPGHSPDHVSLWDDAGGILLASDFIYPGGLFAQVPGSNLSDYAQSCETLLELMPPAARILCAHGQADGNGQHAPPELAKSDVEDLLTALKKLRKTGERPSRVEVNKRVHFLIAPYAYDAWHSGPESI